MPVKEKCYHEKGTNKYFRCQKCGNVLILSKEGVLHEVPATDKRQ